MDSLASLRQRVKRPLPTRSPMEKAGLRVEDGKVVGPAINVSTKAALRELNGPVQYVGGRSDSATVLVLDQFEPTNNGQPSHGEAVVSVLHSAGLEESDIQRVEHKSTTIASTALNFPGPESPGQRLDAMIELRALEDIVSSGLVIEKATAGPDNPIKTITHSIGSSPLEIATGIRDASVEYSEEGEPRITAAGEQVFKALELPKNTDPRSMRKFHQGLVERTTEVLGRSSRVAKAKAKFDRQLGELKSRGVSYFLAAGNTAEEVQDYNENGLPVPEGADTSFKSVPNAFVVGAIDTMDTPQIEDDRLASFSTRDPNVAFLADGVGIAAGEGHFFDGTSFATPLVAAKSEIQRRETSPGSVEELSHTLMSSSPRLLNGAVAIIY